jgi:hypothetical protein
MEVPHDYPELLFRLWYLRLRTFAQEVENGSIQMMRLARRRDPVHYGLRVVRALAPRGTARRRVARAAVDLINPRITGCADLLARISPDAIVVGSPGVIFLDQVFMIEAARRGIPVHCVVNSWDNLTSRGPMIRRPQTLSVWNAYMKDQAVRVHGYPAERTHVVGALQFTDYETPVNDADHRRLYDRLGLPDGSPYVLFLSGQWLPEYEAEDVAMLLRVLEDTRFAGLPVVARIHPQGKVEAFQGIRHPRLILDTPPRFASTGRNGLNFDRSETRAMAALLSRASLVCASWGTTALLEAAIFRKPVIQLRWMDALPRSVPEQREQIRDFQRYEHLKPFDATGSRLFSDHPDDLTDRIEEWFGNRVLQESRCDRAVDELARMPLGRTPHRVIDVLRGAEVAPAAARKSRKTRTPDAVQGGLRAAGSAS